MKLIQPVRLWNKSKFAEGIANVSLVNVLRFNQKRLIKESNKFMP